MKNLWQQIKHEAGNDKCDTTFPLVNNYILSKQSLVDSLIAILTNKLKDNFIDEQKLLLIFTKLISRNIKMKHAIESDLIATFNQDFASKFYHEILLFSRGFLALQAYRLAHIFYNQGNRMLSLWIKDRMAEVFSVDIHTACKIGKRIVLDHAHGLVIGETAVIGNNVVLFHNVTLGSTGKHNGQRHPTVKDNLIIGTGSTLIGNITINNNVRANELVLQ